MFFMRILLLCAALWLYIADRDMLDFTAMPYQLPGGLVLWAAWLLLAVDMLFRLIPNTRIPIGARKHFACSYLEAPEPKNVSAALARLHKGALAGAAFWVVLNVAVFSLLFALNMLAPPAAFTLMLFYSVCDHVCISVFCPFQTFFMHNRCCTVCRIYNWDYPMMCTPMILFPSVYSLSLFLLSVAVLLRWEAAVKKNPRFFMEETNENLSCGKCKNRNCRWS